jgi:hypothetical protein
MGRVKAPMPEVHDVHQQRLPRAPDHIAIAGALHRQVQGRVRAQLPRRATQTLQLYRDTAQQHQHDERDQARGATIHYHHGDGDVGHQYSRRWIQLLRDQAGVRQL